MDLDLVACMAADGETARPLGATRQVVRMQLLAYEMTIASAHDEQQLQERFHVENALYRH